MTCDGCKDGCNSCMPWKCSECGADGDCQDDRLLHLCDDCGRAFRRHAEHANLNARYCRDPQCDVHGDE